MKARSPSLVPRRESAAPLHVGRRGMPVLRATAHASLRYAQRVLGLPIDERQLRDDAALRGRCERGISRLLERAYCAEDGDELEVWVARTRAMVVRDSHVLTVLVAPTSRGFGKRFFRARGLAVARLDR